MRWIVGGCLGLALVACSGDDSAATSETSETTATTSTTTGATSSGATGSATETATATSASGTVTGACDGGCVEAPMGWEGPVVLNVGFDALDCSPGFEEVYVGYSNLDADSYECEECGCDEGDIQCDDIVVSLFTDDACDGQSQCAQTPVSQDSCTPIPAGCDGAAVRFRYTPNPDYLSGACAPTPADPTPTLPTPEWGLLGRACAPTEQGPCPGNATCTLFTPPAIGPCVYAPGNLACPAEFPVKSVLYDDYDDSRGCSACACGEPMDPCQLRVHMTDGTCTAPGSDAIGLDADKCVTLGADQAAVEFETWESCEPSGGESIGELTPTGATTFCCGL